MRPPQPPAEAPAEPPRWGRRLLWFAGLWLASVLALALVAGIIRLLLRA